MIFDILVIPSFFHPDQFVRQVAIDVSKELFVILGIYPKTKFLTHVTRRDRQAKVNDVENIKPSLLRQINDQFARLEKGEIKNSGGKIDYSTSRGRSKSRSKSPRKRGGRRLGKIKEEKY